MDRVSILIYSKSSKGFFSWELDSKSYESLQNFLLNFSIYSELKAKKNVCISKEELILLKNILENQLLELLNKRSPLPKHLGYNLEVKFLDKCLRLNIRNEVDNMIHWMSNLLHVVNLCIKEKEPLNIEFVNDKELYHKMKNRIR